MKNIEIYMIDRGYAKKLNKLLNSKYNDIESEIIDTIESYDENSLLVTDFTIQNIKNYLVILEEDKYKSIDHIYNIINLRYEKLNKINKMQEIITFVNLSEIKSENIIATEIAKEYNKSFNTLLLNFNHFHNYNIVNNELSLDSLLFVKSAGLEIGVNKSKEFNYLSSSQLPLETEKEENTSNILNIIKKQKYQNIVIDLCFYISKRNIEILKNSHKIIFYNKIQSNYSYALKTIEYIKRHLDNNFEEVDIFASDDEYQIIKKEKVLYTKDLEEMVKFVC